MVDNVSLPLRVLFCCGVTQNFFDLPREQISEVHRAAPGIEHVTARELRALLPQAVLARGGNHRPHRRLFRQIGEFRQIAEFGGGRPPRHASEQARHAALITQQRTLLQGQLQAMPA